MRSTRRAHRWAAPALALSAAVALLVGTAPIASADDLEHKQQQVDQQIASLEDDIADASAAERQAAATLVRVQARMPAAQAALDQARGEYAAAQARDAEAAATLRRAEAALRAAEADVRRAEAEMAAQEEHIGSIARAAYVTGPFVEISAVLDSSGPDDFVERAALIRSSFRSTNRALLDAADARAALASREANLTQARSQVQSQREKAAASLARTQQVFARAQAAEQEVAGLVAQQAAAARDAASLRDRLRRQQRELEAESARIAAILRARQSTGTGQIGKGGLMWPANGPVTSPFGYRTHPITGERTFHAGVDIGASSGAPIWAARDGVVVYAGVASGYGNYTCLDHGNGFATCYAHQSSIGVTNGQHVTRGQVIGAVGSTGNSTGPHLHFETRVNGDPVDPMQYF